jgi:two-component system chemotaxis response regulator CheB
MKQENVRVLIVDDSALMRNLIGKIINAGEDLEVADKAVNGKFALEKIPKARPDVIVLDLEMPDMNGIEFLKERKKREIDVPVVILSSLARKGAQITMEALDLGASDFLLKPSGPISEDIHKVGEQLVKTVRVYGQNYKKRKKPAQAQEEEKGEKQKAIEQSYTQDTKLDVSQVLTKKKSYEKTTSAPEIIAIGISTGGPNALREMFQKIDSRVTLPILVVQHMPAGFTSEFAKSLDRICPLEVKEAKDGDLIQPGRVLIAPGNYHMQVERKALAAVVRLSSTDPVNGHRPSADVLFHSVAKAYEEKALAIIMTGMGKDGVRGIGAIKSLGGITIGQDKLSSVVFGMPKVAIESGFIQYIVPLDKMVETITKLIETQKLPA